MKKTVRCPSCHRVYGTCRGECNDPRRFSETLDPACFCPECLEEFTKNYYPLSREVYRAREKCPLTPNEVKERIRTYTLFKEAGF